MSQKRLTKRERFLKVAPKRTQAVLDSLHRLGNCSNKLTYSYSQDEVVQMIDAIESELKRVKSQFYFSWKPGRFELGPE